MMNVKGQRLKSPALRGFIAQRPATERSEIERQVRPHEFV
jgi:hypothetical protein